MKKRCRNSKSKKKKYSNKEIFVFKILLTVDLEWLRVAQLWRKDAERFKIKEKKRFKKKENPFFFKLFVFKIPRNKYKIWCVSEVGLADVNAAELT